MRLLDTPQWKALTVAEKNIINNIQPHGADCVVFTGTLRD